MATYNVTIFDGGSNVSQTIEADSIEAACEMMESQMMDAEDITDGNPNCEPRTDWTASTIGDDYAECSLRGDSQDSQSWAKVKIQARPHA